MAMSKNEDQRRKSTQGSKPRTVKTARIVSAPKPKQSSGKKAVLKRVEPSKPNTTARLLPSNTKPQTVTWKQDGKAYTAKVAMVDGKLKIVGSSGARAQSAVARANRKK